MRCRDEYQRKGGNTAQRRGGGFALGSHRGTICHQIILSARVGSTCESRALDHPFLDHAELPLSGHQLVPHWSNCMYCWSNSRGPLLVEIVWINHWSNLSVSAIGVVYVDQLWTFIVQSVLSVFCRLPRSSMCSEFGQFTDLTSPRFTMNMCSWTCP